VAIADAAMRLLLEYDWPGNVRELRQVIETAAVFARGEIDAASVRDALGVRANSDSLVPVGTYDDRRELTELLMQCDWDTDRAASLLGVHRATIYRRARRLGIDFRRRLSAFGGRRDDSNAHAVLRIVSADGVDVALPRATMA